MNTRLSALIEILELNTRLFLNALDGVDDEKARARPAGGNNMAFIACHLLDARCYLAGMIGIEYEMPYASLLDGARSVDDLEDYPPLDGVRDAWRVVSGLLSERMADMKDSELARTPSQRFPVSDRTLLGGIAFLLQHDSFHVGQLAQLRSQLGLGPMSY